MPAYFVLTQMATDMEKYQKEYIPGVCRFWRNTRGKWQWPTSRLPRSSASQPQAW